MRYAFSYLNGSNIDAGAATFHIRYNYPHTFQAGETTIHRVIFNSIEDCGMTGSGSFNKIMVQGTGEVKLEDITADSVMVDAGKTLELDGTVTVIDYLEMNGTCSLLSNLKGPGILSSSTGNILVNYTNIENITATGGASFVANDSYDLGGNSGWTINGNTAKDYYWVGDGGSWNDGSHWALTSGGAGSGCVPTFQDDVYFDANSFSATGQTLIISASEAYTKSMNWTGVTNTPTFSILGNDLNIYGSLTFSPNMTETSRPTKKKCCF